MQHYSPHAKNCGCTKPKHPISLVVLTGGPGAGKTAVLEMAHRMFCSHVAVLPEAASIIFKGGFWRGTSTTARRAAQRAIYHVQTEQERMLREEKQHAIVLCDRGTIDGLAYWPGSESSFFKDLGSTREKEMAHYHTVIHLKTPTTELGYNHVNPERIEPAKEAAEIDARIEKAWHGHPRRFFVQSTADFVLKAQKAIELLSEEIPKCCR